MYQKWLFEAIHFPTMNEDAKFVILNFTTSPVNPDEIFSKNIYFLVLEPNSLFNSLG